MPWPLRRRWCRFIPIKLYDGYARKRDTLTYTIVREF